MKLGKANIKFSNLRAEMARNEITIKELADKIGVNRDTMSGKLSGKRPLYLNEAFAINRAFFPNEDIGYLFKEVCDDKTNKN